MDATRAISKSKGAVQVSKAAYDDGLVELYALTKGALAPGWTPNSVPEHTLRLGQGSAVRVCLQGDLRRAAKSGSKRSSSEADAAAFMLVDGEAWWQDIPTPTSLSSTMSSKNAISVRAWVFSWFVLAPGTHTCMRRGSAFLRLVCVSAARA